MTTSKVLVVDDDRSISKLVQIQLDLLGLEAVACDNIATAKQLLAAQTFKFVLSDINMPGGSGVELAQWVHQTHSRLPFYLMTGQAMDVSPAALRDCNVLDVLHKPFHISDLVTMITAQLDQTFAPLSIPSSQSRAPALQL